MNTQTLTTGGEHCTGPYRRRGLIGEQSTKSTRTRRRTLSQATRAAEKKRKKKEKKRASQTLLALSPTFGAQPGDLARRRRGQDRRQVILLEHVQLGLVSSAVRHGVFFVSFFRFFVLALIGKREEQRRKMEEKGSSDSSSSQQQQSRTISFSFRFRNLSSKNQEEKNRDHEPRRCPYPRARRCLAHRRRRCGRAPQRYARSMSGRGESRARGGVEKDLKDCPSFLASPSLSQQSNFFPFFFVLLGCGRDRSRLRRSSFGRMLGLYFTFPCPLRTRLEASRQLQFDRDR